MLQHCWAIDLAGELGKWWINGNDGDPQPYPDGDEEDGAAVRGASQPHEDWKKCEEETKDWTDENWQKWEEEEWKKWEEEETKDWTDEDFVEMGGRLEKVGGGDKRLDR